MKLRAWSSSLFSKLVSIFKEFIAIALPLAKQEIIAQLKDFSVKIVNELDSTTFTNEQKRKEALKRILDEARNRGIELSDSLGNLIIELALQFIKSRS